MTDDDDIFWSVKDAGDEAADLQPGGPYASVPTFDAHKFIDQLRINGYEVRKIEP